ncbi:NADPH:quinone reductase [Paractinoplanes abujensis]|nr:NADPH:quinone reductase [Actinoplanes abujensis]
MIRKFGGPEVLDVAEVASPEPGPGQVRIRVAAACVNRIDISTRDGALARAGLLAAAPPIGLGWDVSGEIDRVGEGVRRFAPGDAVIGLRDVLSGRGTQAELVVLDESAVAPAPAGASPVEAATLPLLGLTADRSLGLTGLRAGQTLLVTGAAGGVGTLVLELAALRGIRTVGLAGPADEALVRSRGAEFVARTSATPDEGARSSEADARDVAGAEERSRNGALAEAVRRLVPGGVDAVIDTAVIGVAAHEAVRGGGTFVALVAPFAPPALRATSVVVQEVCADGARLTELSALAAAGHLTLRTGKVFALGDVADAHRLLVEGGQRGRLVLVP